jgi:hypothetical protein
MEIEMWIPAGDVDEVERETQRQMRHFLPKLTLELGREPSDREVTMLHAALFQHLAAPHEVAPDRPLH